MALRQDILQLLIYILFNTHPMKAKFAILVYVKIDTTSRNFTKKDGAKQPANKENNAIKIMLFL